MNCPPPPLRFVQLAFVASLVFATAVAAAPRNVLLIVADDHGRDIGAYGNPVIQTPNMDRLAREGVRFTHAFCTTASCSPSRSVILTGLHNHANGQYGLQHGIHHFSTFETVQSLPKILARNGYRTARVGKYHLWPESVYPFETVIEGNVGGKRNPTTMAEASRDFIADRSKPFFLYYCTSDPHRSDYKPTHLPYGADAFGNHQVDEGGEQQEYRPEDVIVPSFLSDTPETRVELAQYYQSVSRVDRGVGRLMEVLRESGQYDDTLIIYLSDNGIAMPGAKTNLYDPGMHLPLIVRHPSAPDRGRTSEAMVSWVDIVPTILDFAGIDEVMAPPLIAGNPETPAPRPTEEVPYRFHGRSFLPLLDHADAPTDEWDEVYASHSFHSIITYYPMRVVRTHRYKLIFNLAHPLSFPFSSDLWPSATWRSIGPDEPNARLGGRLVRDYLQRPKYELYDLAKDPDELVNLADDPGYQDVLHDLQQRIRRFQEQTGDPWAVKYQHE